MGTGAAVASYPRPAARLVTGGELRGRGGGCSAGRGCPRARLRGGVVALLAAGKVAPYSVLYAASGPSQLPSTPTTG